MRIVATAVLVLLLTGCASMQSGTATRGSRNEISHDAIVQASQPTAEELVETLRPQWLRRRGAVSMQNPGDIWVYVDGVRRGPPSALAGIPSTTIESIRFFDAIRAQQKFGVGHEFGVIEVITRRY